jgi:hypothetical protein
MAEVLGRSLPGVGLAYNGFGAFASVNHLHFQFFVRGEPLPIADPAWHHNGGGIRYPIGCTTYHGVDPAWDAISALNAEGASYNLIYLRPASPAGDLCPAVLVRGSGLVRVGGRCRSPYRRDLRRAEAGRGSSCHRLRGPRVLRRSARCGRFGPGLQPLALSYHSRETLCRAGCCLVAN